MISDAQFETWSLSPAKESRRLLICEANHAGGTVRIASLPWLSPNHQAYDDALVREPYMEESLFNFAGVGDFEALNLDGVELWDNLLWYGHRCTWSIGDVDWLREDFRAVARSTIREVRPLGSGAYRFNLMNDGRRFDQTLVTVDTTRTDTVGEAVDWINETIGESVTLTNLAGRETRPLSLMISASDTAAKVLRKIAASINAHLRTDALGNADIVHLVSGGLTITDDMLDGQTVAVTETRAPTSAVTVTWGTDDTRTSNTNSDLGGQANVLSVDTYLQNSADVDDLLDEMVAQSMNGQNIYALSLLSGAELLRVGDPLTVISSELTGPGNITRVRRTPLSRTTQIEVIV